MIRIFSVLVADSKQIYDNNTNILNHIQLAPYQTSMRFDKISNMLFLNDLNPSSEKTSKLNFRLLQL